MYHALDNILISSKLFQITQQRKEYSSVSCIAFHCYPTLLLVYPGQSSPFHFHCKGEIVSLEQTAVVFQRSGTISEIMLCLRFRNEGSAYSFLFVCFFLSFPLFPSWCFFSLFSWGFLDFEKIDKSENQSKNVRLLLHIPLPINLPDGVKDLGSVNAQLLHC